MGGIDNWRNAETDEQDESKDMLEYFHLVTNIQRSSGDEADILSFVAAELILMENNCIREKDDYGNMAVHLPASPGYEDCPRIVIQAHADMVCIGGNDKKPVKARVAIKDGEEVVEAPEETLGADNGAAGIAVPLAILKQGYVHGPITYLLTIREEEGLKGAKNLDPKLIPEDAAIFINLDAEDGPDKIFKGCAGGARISAEFQTNEKEKLPADYQVVSLAVIDCPGGHSGLDIHKNSPSAVKELNDVLLQLLEKENINFKLVSFNGGEKSNSIPITAKAQIAVPESQVESVRVLAREICKSKGLKVRTSCPKSSNYTTISQSTRNQLFEALKAIPQGVLQAEGKDVISSNNIPLVRTLDDSISLLSMARSAKDAELDEIEDDISKILEKTGAQIIEVAKYCGWLEADDSKAIKLAQIITRKFLKVEPTTEIMHAGLENGAIAERIAPRKIPMVSIGPRIKNVHKKGEYVVINDLFKICKVLKYMINEVAENPKDYAVAA